MSRRNGRCGSTCIPAFLVVQLLVIALGYNEGFRDQLIGGPSYGPDIYQYTDK